MYKVSFRKFDIDGVTIVFRDTGVEVALASPKGGQADPKALRSLKMRFQRENLWRSFVTH
jgi:hypothetical protein